MSDQLEGEPPADPRQIGRHEFLGRAGMGTAAAALAFSTIGMLRLPKPRVLPDVSSVVRLGKPSQFPPGTIATLAEHKIHLVATDRGVAAMSLVCTHLGCIVKPTETGFDCPCHGSKFDSQGKVLGGPAPRGLRWLAVSQAPDGTLLADRAKEVDAEETYKASV